MAEAAWRRRFRAPRVTLPGWARERPERTLYGSNASGTWELYAWDLSSDTHRQVTERREGTLRGTLDPSGEWVWWFDDDDGNELGVWVRELFTPETPGGPDRARAGSVAPDLGPAYGAGLALGDGVAVIGRSIDDATTVHLVRPDEDRQQLIYEHREDAGVGGLSRDGSLVALSHSEHGDSRHPALRVVTPAGEAVEEMWDGPGQGLVPLGFSRVAGDPRLLVLHERADLPRPLVWDPTTGDEVLVDVDLPGEVAASWYPDGDALLLVHDHRGRSELYRYELDEGRLEPLTSEAGTVTAARVRPDGELWYSWTSSATPPEVRRGTRVLLRPDTDPAPPGAAYTDLDVDGIHGFVALPSGDARAEAATHADGRLPTVFLVHGGPEAHDSDSFAPEPQAFVDHGFAVVLVNYRGSTGYGKAWRDALEGEPGPGFTELEDIAKVHDWAAATEWADPERMVLAGHSWGGYLTLLGLGLQPERWALGIAGVPVADYVAAYEDEMEPLKAFDRALFGGSPDEVPQRYRERSPITHAEHVAAPVLVLAGENDPRCPIRQIDNYLARLDELGTPHERYRYQAGHGSLVVDERIRQVEAMLDFARRHLGTPPPR